MANAISNSEDLLMQELPRQARSGAPTPPISKTYVEANKADDYFRVWEGRLVLGHVCRTCDPVRPIAWAVTGSIVRCRCGRTAPVPPVEFPYTHISQIKMLGGE